MILRLAESRTAQRFFRSRLAVAGLVTYGLLIVVALFAPLLSPYDPNVQRLEQRLEGPSLSHPFGLDDLGRDVFSRVIHGSRISLRVGLIVVLISGSVGITLGTVAGWYGGWYDEILMRLTDILLAFPGLLLAIAMVAVLGPGIDNVILALSLTGWVGFARLTRGQVLQARELDFIQAARALGAGDARIVILHVLPTIMAPLLVEATFGMAAAILGEASLSFLGLGVSPPTPSWGGILDQGVDKIAFAQHITIFPGMAIMITVLALNFLGDGLRDAFDPRTNL